jgi:hypothetical protein
MSNTVIQIKRSLTNSQPPSLNVAELAYSYQSNTIFIGTPDGTGTIAIGGKAYLDIQNNIYSLVNAAFGVANSQTSSLTAANQAGVIANAAFGHSNTTYAAVNSAFGVINAAFSSANTVGGYVNTVGGYANTVGGYANQAGVIANAAFGAANQAGVVANNSNTWVNSTFVKLTAPSQTITGDLAITGNLSFYGNATFIDTTTLTVGDSLVYLAANNIVNDVIDIGWVANYNNGTSNVHTGLYRDHVSKEYFLFQGFDIEPGSNNIITPYANNMVNAVLNADLITSNLTLGGANAIVWIKAAYDNSNGAFGVTNAAFGHSNTVYGAVNSAFGVINAAYTSSNANYVLTNAAYTSSNAAYVVVNSAYTVVNAAYTSSNAGYVVANAAFNYANVANAYLTNTFSSAANISSGTLPSGRLSGSYTGITGVGTITTGTWNGSTVNVGYGGTGIISATLNGVLFGGGGNAAFQVTAAGTEGQVLTASSTGVPQFSMLSGGTF